MLIFASINRSVTCANVEKAFEFILMIHIFAKTLTNVKKHFPVPKDALTRSVLSDVLAWMTTSRKTKGGLAELIQVSVFHYSTKRDNQDRVKNSEY